MAVRFYQCHYCGTMLTSIEVTRDHVVPKYLIHRDDRWNLVDSCRPCNSDKADRWPSCKCNKCRKAKRLAWELFRIKNPRKYKDKHND